MADNYVGHLIQSERVKRGWRFGDLARACGALTPKQVSKMAQRLVVFERESVLDGGLLKKVIAALDLHRDLVRSLLRREYYDERIAEWEAWADEPVRPVLALKGGPVWVHRSIPHSVVTEEEAINYTTDFIKENPVFHAAVLVFNRRVRHVFEGGRYVGRRESAPLTEPMPHMSISGTPFTLNVGGDE